MISTFKTVAIARNSISVIKRCPLSIRWTAFLSTSIPISCNFSASIRCDIFGAAAFLIA